MNKITIITPTFNRAKTLPKVFESLLNQSFKDFLWIILDDGSTDNTTELVENFQLHNPFFEIIYKKDKNRHKFLTVLEGIKMVKTPYFMMVDSDDIYPENSLEILISEAEKIENQDKFIGVMGLSADENGKIVGDKYPNNGFDGSIFEMRYKYKVRGDKFGIFITKTYHREISVKDFLKYEGKGYIPQSVIFNDYDAKGVKTRFINKIVRFYLKDNDDVASVSNTRWSEKNLFGLAEGHLSFLNSYGNRLFFYPKALLRNLIGYQTYSLKSGRKTSTIINEIKNVWIKILGIFVLPFSFIYQKLK
ncbi:glycosyltransferase family A protein [Cloacibacterium sp.]|uniref:glycosyltransferase family A protein n=1 Tax=Cloacibacterium sp. TaxID=1913682 RepID=UPI0039E2C13A